MSRIGWNAGVWLLALIATITLSTISSVEAVSLQEIARFDVSGIMSGSTSTGAIGSNVTAVSWHNSQAAGPLLYIAGFNNAGATADAGIAQVTNAGSTGLQAATFSAPFGVLSTPNLRGYSGLAITDDGVTLAAAYDDGAADPNGIQAFATSTNTQNWAKDARGGSGVGIDPGFGGGGAGVGWTTFGSGRRALQNTATGADIFTTGDGMIINGAGTGTFWRDMDFAPSGDIWLREGNNVIQGVRNGANSLSATNLVVDEPEADFVNNQNLEYLAGTPFGDFVIFNDREVTSSGQEFTNQVKLIAPDGTNIGFGSLGLLAPINTGNGAYDFSYHPATNTLAISDFENNNVHIFSIVPEPGALLLMLIASLGLFVCRVRS